MTAPSVDILTGGEPESLQSHLEDAGHRGVDGAQRSTDPPPISDPIALFRHLEASGRFHRDTGLGRVFHPGDLSLRENLPSDSLHVLIRDNHVAAHVDRVSPLGLRPERRYHYSLRRAAAHNLAGMVQDLFRLLRGRQGDHRSELDCEWVWDPSVDVVDPKGLLDPATSAWSVHLEVQLGGSLDEARLRRALTVALGGRPPEQDSLDVADCPDDASLDEERSRLQTTPVAVTDWPPLRALLARRPDGDVLMLNVNHAAGDGFGAVTVLRAIARAYAGEAHGGAWPDLLATRDLPVRPASAPVWAGPYRAVVERLRDLLARPAHLAADEPDDEPGYGFLLLRLSSEETQRVMGAASPGTTRDVLLGALHLAIGYWNLQHGAPGRRVGVLVPVNLRHPRWPEEVIGNFSVTARISTSRRHRRDGTSALRAVTAQTTRNRRTRTGIALLAALERTGLLPLWTKQSLIVLQSIVGNRLADTAMLAHLGRQDAPWFGPDAGETKGVWFSVPARAPRALCVGTVTVAGRMHLTLRYPHRLFGPDAARRFADCYLAHLRTVAQGAS
ncbi:MAG: hypothetical protein M3N11_05585 [Actinomycetota bacterium]|nr:hypothetical protein [Actinomycetota bacterium]